MSKQIRPLSAYKKQNPEIYAMISELSKEDTTSQKGRENNWYWWYASLEMKIDKDPFLFSPSGSKRNMGTVSEIGRLLLSGWYYGIMDWAQDVALFVYKSYHRKVERGEPFNDLEFKGAVKYIRDNMAYYYQNEVELKMYILETFFKDYVDHLLPEPPEDLKRHKEALNLLKEEHKNRLKKDKNWYIKNFEAVDGYCYYLSEILDSYSIPYLSLEDWEAEEAKEWRGYWERVEDAEKKYKSSLKNISLPKLPTPKKGTDP